MKRFILNLGTVLLLAAAFLQAGFKSAQQRNNLSHAGAIMDSTCAGQESHNQEMTTDGTKTAKDCALLCAKGGSKSVLYNHDAKASLNIDDQDKVREYSAGKVAVGVTADSPSKTVHVQSITAAH